MPEGPARKRVHSRSKVTIWFPLSHFPIAFVPWGQTIPHKRPPVSLFLNDLELDPYLLAIIYCPLLASPFCWLQKRLSRPFVALIQSSIPARLTIVTRLHRDVWVCAGLAALTQVNTIVKQIIQGAYFKLLINCLVLHSTITR